MACDCIEKIPQMVREQKMNDPGKKDGYRVIDMKWDKMFFYPLKSLYTSIKVNSSFTKVNGTQSAPRNEDIDVVFTYCPFCGVKYEE